MLRRRISPARGGGCTVRLPSAERELLRSLPEQLDEVLAAVEGLGTTGPTGAGGAGGGSATGDEWGDEGGRSDTGGDARPPGPEAPPVLASLRRLFPLAYTTDEEAQRNYESLTRSELSSHHRRALSTLARTADATALDADQLNEWLTAVNDLRLVLGTVLGVTEDEPPLATAASSQMIVYLYLSQLEAELVDVLGAWLPDPLPGADDQIPDDPWGEPLGGLRWDGTPVPRDDV